jgi:hypothetical protein
MTTPRIEETASKLTREILLENNIAVEDILTKALTEAHQAGIDEAVEVLESKKKSLKGIRRSSFSHNCRRITNQALDDTIKALKDKK